MTELVITPFVIRDKREAERERGRRAANCFRRLLEAAKTQVGGEINWYALGLGEAAAAIEAWDSGDAHGFFALWDERRSSTRGRYGSGSMSDEAIQLLIDGISEVVTLGVEAGRRKEGRSHRTDQIKLGTLAQIFFTQRLLRALSENVETATDVAVNEAVADMGRRLARQLTYSRLDEVTARIARRGDDYGRTLARALDGAVTIDGITWEAKGMTQRRQSDGNVEREAGATLSRRTTAVET